MNSSPPRRRSTTCVRLPTPGRERLDVLLRDAAPRSLEALEVRRDRRPLGCVEQARPRLPASVRKLPG